MPVNSVPLVLVLSLTFRFRKRLSSKYAIIKLNHKIYKASDNEQYVCSVFIHSKSQYTSIKTLISGILSGQVLNLPKKEKVCFKSQYTSIKTLISGILS